jgi:hypothetical protein
MTTTAFIRRALIRGALASTILVPVLAAQSSKMTVVDIQPRLSVNLQDFELRRHTGLGTFISDSVLRASEHFRMSTLLEQRIPSLMFATNGYSGETPVSSRVCSGSMACSAPRCYIRIFLDGMLTFDGTPQMRGLQGIDVSLWRPQDFSGIEFHASSAGLPAQYGGPNADCGTLMFWSRET